MTNMENLESQLGERERQQKVNEEAINRINAQKLRSEARGYAVISAAMAYGEGSQGRGAFGKISHASKLFCILFAFVIPSVLIWHVVL